MYYTYKAETWDHDKCLKMSKHVAKDGMGTKYPFSGYIGSSTATPCYGGFYGTIKYNGGCIHDGQWYQGEVYPLPIIHPDFDIVHVQTWGYRIVKK